MKDFKASALVLDFEIYPRGRVDSQAVGYIANALQAGATMPPIVIEKKSHRIVDGAHRFKAYRRLYGDDVKISCVEKVYKSDRDLLLDCIRLNTAHGNNLTPFDRARCITLADKMGIDSELLAGAMNMTVTALDEMKVDRLASDPAGLHVPLKRTNRHMAGKTLTHRQMEANQRSSGMNQAMYANQLIDLIESDLIDVNNDRLMERLKYLQELLSNLLVAA